MVETVDGVSYLDDVIDELRETIDGLDDEEAATIIAAYLLDLRLEELADSERYEEEVGPLDEINTRWNKGSKKKESSKSSRPARRSQRTRKSESEEPEDTDETEADEKPKPARGGDKKAKFDDMRKRAAKKREAKE